MPRQSPAVRGLWMVGANRVAHHYPGIHTATAGQPASCRLWTSTKLDEVEGVVDVWCPTCKEISER